MTSSTYAPPGTVAPEPSAADSQPAENEAPKKKTEPRPYHVFKQTGETTWHWLTTADATSPEAAIKTLGLDAVDGSTYAAVPVRYWTQKTPKKRPESVTF